jgi:bifunctional DNA-binding transcriptional regulator/antitoxin component of YhaV-PrlF toxin-antitoxin module
MLSKLTAKNQITIPKDILKKLPDVKYFDVELKDGAVLLKPVKVYDTDLESIHDKMRKLGLSESSVAEAVRWARSK